MIHNFSIIGSKSFKISFHKSEFYSEFNEKNFKIFILKIVQYRTISDFFGIKSEISQSILAIILENILSLPKDIIGRRKTILLSVVTLAGSLAGIVLSPKLGSWKYLLLFCTTAGFSCGAQAKMTLPMEIFGTKERSSIGRVFTSTSGNYGNCAESTTQILLG